MNLIGTATVLLVLVATLTGKHVAQKTEEEIQKWEDYKVSLKLFKLQPFKYR